MSALANLNLLEGFFEKLPVPFRWDTFGKLWEKNATSIEKIRTSSIESESRSTNGRAHVTNYSVHFAGETRRS